jgi:hypothetical protein
MILRSGCQTRLRENVAFATPCLGHELHFKAGGGDTVVTMTIMTRAE